MAERDDANDIADRPVTVQVSEPQTIGHGFRPYERYSLELSIGQATPLAQQRDIVRGGRVVGVLPIDLDRDRIVLLRQFRLAAHLVTGKGEMIEIVAGRVDEGESDADAARRECHEEIGVTPVHLVRLYAVMPAPAVTDEFVMTYLGFVDSTRVTPYGGLAHESEHIETLVVPIDDALEALRQGRIANALTVSALQWLALNRTRLPALHDAAVATGGVTQG